MPKNKGDRCELCGREEVVLTFHHLIPRTLHSNKKFKKLYTREELCRGIEICTDCHRNIHNFITEKDMGRQYNTIEALMEHEKVKKFVNWIAKRG
jgi:hypothetical protein